MDWPAFCIRVATAHDIDACDRIARQHPLALGWVMRTSLRSAAERGGLYVAQTDAGVVGFVEWAQPTRGANKGWTVVYHLAVDKAHQGAGIGKRLLHSVPTPIRLKCPVALADAPNPANAFYASLGMMNTGTDTTRGGKLLNVWEMRVLCIHVQGNNREIPDACKASGMAYGTRHVEKPRAWPLMVDIYWKKYDWADYLSKVQAWRPVMAMAADYEGPDQRDMMLQQVADLRAAGVLRVMVCPKFAGAVADIPADCIVAVSVPSQYAGYLPADHELAGRRIHLLGGAPGKQMAFVRHYAGVGAQVVSIDGNAHYRAAMFGSQFDGSVWKRPPLRFGKLETPLYDVMVNSARAIVKYAQIAAEVRQLSMFGGL